jgi:hypothetical protein
VIEDAIEPARFLGAGIRAKLCQRFGVEPSEFL